MSVKSAGAIRRLSAGLSRASAREFRLSMKKRGEHALLQNPIPVRAPIGSIDCVRTNGLGDYVITGWLHDFAQGTTIWLVGDGHSILCPAASARPKRDDVREHLFKDYGVTVTEEPGFIVIVQGAPDISEHSLRIELRGAFGTSSYTPTQVMKINPQMPQGALEFISLASKTKGWAIYDDLGPVIERTWAARTRVNTSTVIDYGTLPHDPEVSIIIPLYSRIDFAEHQLLAFSQDPGMGGAEIIYVLDDPRLEDDLKRHAQRWHELYGISFRCVYNTSNLGFAGANNEGIRYARAPYLLLMNSDVFPARANWLGALRSCLDTLPDAGIVSPLMLYSDESVQYAGMVFRQGGPDFPFYLNHHQWRGLGRPPYATPPYEVEAATGACLFMRTDLYRELGGLDEGFIIGDFEDSDLCMKVRERGHTIWCDPSTSLFHLERQSLRDVAAADWRMALVAFNAWRHNNRWATKITSLKKEMCA